MRSPSPRVLRNRVNIFVGAWSQDAQFAPQKPFSGIPTEANVPCSVQCVESRIEVIDDRLTTVNVYRLIFGARTPLTPRDLIQWTENSTVHSMFADGIKPSEAGRGGTYVINAIEKI